MRRQPEATETSASNAVSDKPKSGRRHRGRWLLLTSVVVLLGYCSFVPPPARISMDYPLAAGEAEAVTREFWTEFQADRFASVQRTDCPDGIVEHDAGGTPDMICRLEAAAAVEPGDVQLPNIVAAGYNWRVQRRVLPEDSENDLRAGRRWAAAAVSNGNPMAAGFEASPTWLLGFLLDSDSLKVEAYREMVSDTQNFPAFHGFVEGASLPPMLNPEAPDPRFEYENAIQAFLENIDACFFGEGVFRWLHAPEGMKMNRFLFNAGAFVSWISKRQYCYNNPAAPFNMQGLYIAQGDAYLKQGNSEMARVAYENALASPNGDNWVFADAVRYRLENMEETRQKFLADSGLLHPDPEPVIMVAQSSWYCASCHFKPSDTE